MQEAKNYYNNLKVKIEKQLIQEQSKIKSEEQILKQKEEQLYQRRKQLKEHAKQLELLRKSLEQRAESLQQQLQQADRTYQAYQAQVEKVSALSAQEAREQLIAQLKEEIKAEAVAEVQSLLEETYQAVEKEAKTYVAQAIQSMAAEQANEISVTAFDLENDDLKGRIIGREGRNIRTIESATGCELIIDDTPGVITISAFDPYRRAITSQTLQRLVVDGRIHPNRIYESVKKAKKAIEEEIRALGENTVIELGIYGLHPEIVRLIGKMHYLRAQEQSLLQHAKEVAILCGWLATELELDSTIAKRAGLLHDIGKVAEGYYEFSHAIAGMRIAERYKERPEVCNAIGAHHNEIPMKSLIAPIVHICNIISNLRPGTRKEIFENYLQRLKDLEPIILSFKEVEKGFVLQVGNEIRIIAQIPSMNDHDKQQLRWHLIQKVEEHVKQSIPIKVQLITPLS